MRVLGAVVTALLAACGPSKQQREAATNAINADIQRRASLAGNMAQVTGTMTNSLQNFRMQ